MIQVFENRSAANVEACKRPKRRGPSAMSVIVTVNVP